LNDDDIRRRSHDSSHTMQRTATCACGQASITLSGDPALHGVCHCTNCKRRTGSAFGISAYFPKASIAARSGEMNVYAFHHASQNHDQERRFCSRCGTTLFWHVSTMPDLVGIAAGCFAEGALNEPTFSATHGKKEAWVTLPSDWRLSPK
jgi:hypothetical protein